MNIQMTKKKTNGTMQKTSKKMTTMGKKMFLFCTLLIGAVAAMAPPSGGDRFAGLP